MNSFNFDDRHLTAKEIDSLYREPAVKVMEPTAGELLEAAYALERMGQTELAERFRYYSKRFEPIREDSSD